MAGGSRPATLALGRSTQPHPLSAPLPEVHLPEDRRTYAPGGGWAVHGGGRLSLPETRPLGAAGLPAALPGEITAARDLLPERVFRQEYLAEFLDDAGGVFRKVEAAACAAVESGPQPGERYVFGVDWGRENDFTCIAVLAVGARRLVALDRFNEVGWSLQRGRLAALAHTWQPEAIWAEANIIGGPNIEALQAEGLPVCAFTTTASSKGPLIEGLALALERGDLAILPEPVLLHELQAFTLERLPSGRFRYGAPPGEHDDTVIALALAWHGATSGGTGISFV